MKGGGEIFSILCLGATLLIYSAVVYLLENTVSAVKQRHAGNNNVRGAFEMFFLFVYKIKYIITKTKQISTIMLSFIKMKLDCDCLWIITYLTWCCCADTL